MRAPPARINMREAEPPGPAGLELATAESTAVSHAERHTADGEERPDQLTEGLHHEGMDEPFVATSFMISISLWANMPAPRS
jgi:hypothetical protein